MSLRVVDLEDGSIVSTINWPLPRAWPEGHQPSASTEIEPYAAIAVDLQ